MRRILLLLTVVMVRVAMIAVTAAPALAVGKRSRVVSIDLDPFNNRLVVNSPGDPIIPGDPVRVFRGVPGDPIHPAIRNNTNIVEDLCEVTPEECSGT
jgi:hypothetical protein